MNTLPCNLPACPHQWRKLFGSTVSRITRVLLIVAIFLLTGCVASPPAVDPARDIATATGAGDPIVYHTQGQPADQQGGATDHLDLPSAIRLMLQNEPRIQAALSRVRIAQAEAEQTRLLPNPIISISIRYPEGLAKPIIDAGLASDLIALLQQPRRADAADQRLRAATSNAITTALDLLASVQEHYIAIQSVDEQTRVLNERLKAIDRLLETAHARLKVGEITQLDVATLEAERVVLEADIADQQLEGQEERLALARLIGQPSSHAIWRLTIWQAPESVTPSESAWIQAALKHRPEVQSHLWELAALGDDLALTQFALWDGTTAGIASERDGPWSVGPALTLPLPIFDMGQARAAKARSQVEEARHKLTDIQRQVIEETRRALAAFIASQASYAKIRDRLLPLQKRRHDLAESAYRAGQTDITAFFLAEQDLRQAESKLITQAKKSISAYIRLQRAAGGPGPAEKLDRAPTTPPTVAPPK